MANNPYVNKVELADGTTLIDLTSDTVVASKIVSGYTAHDASGALITGSIPIKSYSSASISNLTIIGDAGYYPDGINTGIRSITIPDGSDLEVCNYGTNYDFSLNYGGTLNVCELTTPTTIIAQNIVDDGEWVTYTPTAYGTYYGKTVVNSSILQAAYPVGSLYATESSTDNPATILGFGTWTKYAPADLNWNDTDLDWNNTVGVTSGIYVWKRTA